MITPFDDYPVHQTALPVAHPAGDPNFYDRFFFNGYDPDGEWFFAAALGLYPNRGVIDAAFSVVRDGVQRSVFASGRIPADRTHTTVGPITIGVVEPLGVNRVHVDAAHLGIEAVLEWRPRTVAVEEPRQTITAGATTVMDVTRLLQWGAWSGTVEVDGARIQVDDRARGTKDRSWGIRPLGDPVPGAPPPGLAGGGFFMMWVPVHFQDRCTHAILFEQADGHRWFESAFAVPVDDVRDPVAGAANLRHAGSVVYDVDFAPGTRRARAATVTLPYRDGERDVLSLDPVLRFHMKGLGYLHPDWPHGRWHGESAEGSDTWKLDELDPLDLTNVHVQQVCRVRCADQAGVGILEQLIIGPHTPTGFEGFDDGAPA